MTNTPYHSDPEIAALLQFDPVIRRCRRHDGWLVPIQRAFIVLLVATGDANKAAQLLGRTMSGAYKVRTAAGGEGFGDAWDAAVALYLRRNPKAPLQGRWRPGHDPAVVAQRSPSPNVPPEPESGAQVAAKWQSFVDGVLKTYLFKLIDEREARLAGHIVEADFIVRQLTWIEVVLDVGGASREALNSLQRDGYNVRAIAATPMSLLLDKIRRQVWAEADEPDRPPLAVMDFVEPGVAIQPPAECEGYPSHPAHSPESIAIAAEAQRIWEEKARADAAAWRARLEANGSGNQSA